MNRAVRVTDRFRVAGKSPSQIDAEMVERLFRRIEERREYEAQLKEIGYAE